MKRVKKDEHGTSGTAAVLLFIGVVLFFIGIITGSCGLILISFFFDIVAAIVNWSSSSSSTTTSSSNSSTSTYHLEEELEEAEEGICPTCGAVIPIDSDECPECGEELEPPEEEIFEEEEEVDSSTSGSLSRESLDYTDLSQKETKGCPYCAKKIGKDENTCPNCGQTLFGRKEGIKVETEDEQRKITTVESAQSDRSILDDRAGEKHAEKTRCLSGSDSDSKYRGSGGDLRCLECGVMNNNDNNYCIYCGSELEE